MKQRDIHTQWLAGRYHGGQDARKQEAVCIAVIIGTIFDVVRHIELLIGIIAADQPIQAAIEQFALKADFLGEQPEPAIKRCAMHNVERAKIRILALPVLVVAIGRDCGQLGITKTPVEFTRKAPILCIRGVVEARCGRLHTIELVRRCNLNVGPERLQDGEQGVWGVGQGAGDQAGIAVRAIIDRAAAQFGALAIIADDPDADVR